MEPLLPLDEDHQSYSGWVGGHSENRGRTAQLWNDTVNHFQVTQKMCFPVIEACAGIHHHDCTT